MTVLNLLRPARALSLALCLLPCFAQAVTVDFKPVADGVYAHVGDTGARTAENEGLNANIGLVVTPAGAVLIDSGATFQSARQIAEAARKVTSQPIKWVVNTGGQDHRWLGNGYFQAQGAELIAHTAGEADMKSRRQRPPPGFEGRARSQGRGHGAHPALALAQGARRAA